MYRSIFLFARKLRFDLLILPLLILGGMSLYSHFKLDETVLSQTVAGLETIQLIDSAFCLAGAFLTIRMVDCLVWHGLFASNGRDIPKMVRELIALAIWIATGIIITGLVFEKSLFHILTASTVAFGVIGFALQRPIMDAYSGIVISLQKPIKQGDWIQIDGKEVARVVDMDWRTVTLVTKSEITYIVPNSKLANETIKSFSAPEPFFRDSLDITLPYSVTTHQGKRILLGAVNQIEEIAKIPRNSLVSIEEFDDSGVVWKLHYWCPDPGQRGPLRFRVFQNILANLHFANISIPSPVLEVRRGVQQSYEPRPDGIDPLLQRISLFAGLSDDELRYLTENSMLRLVLAGKPIIVQGELGDSLFILRDGLLAVKIKIPSGDEIEVARITPGNFFGEKSLLMGEPRTASIFSVVDSTVIEISRESIATLLQQRPQIVEQMSAVISSREIANKRKMADSQNKHIEDEGSLSHKIMSKILTFFDLK